MAEDAPLSPPPPYLADRDNPSNLRPQNGRNTEKTSRVDVNNDGLVLRNLTIRELLQSENSAAVPMSFKEPVQAKTPSSMTDSTMDIDSADFDRNQRDGSVVSIDDPDVRLAAEALGDLKADFVQSPSSTSSRRNIPYSPPQSARTETNEPSVDQAEPLLSLFTSSHPLLGNAINGSLSAYSSSKSYSPSFRYGAEFVERHIGSPVANTVGTVGRKTGVEGGVRWLLSSQRPNEDDMNATKREDASDLEKALPDGYMYAAPALRRESNASFADSLPAYDENRAPSYDSVMPLVVTGTKTERDAQASTSNPNWSRRIMLSTSGLGVSMSDESLRSLKYCLSWLRWANVHLHRVIGSLKGVLDEWDQSQRLKLPTDSEAKGESLQNVADAKDTEAELGTRIRNLRSEVLQTLQKVVDIISTYTGAALPENARNLVRGHLISLPQRFWLASVSEPIQVSSNPTSQMASSAHKVMVLTKEGLDMLSQVSTVVDGTIRSAEDWCQRLGRKPASDEPAAHLQGNEKMPIDDERRAEAVDTRMATPE